jgi:hypothetical protein
MEYGDNAILKPCHKAQGISRARKKRLSNKLRSGGIITVVEGRRSSPNEVRLAPLDLQKYLSNEFEALLSNRDFIDALPGYLTFDTASQQRAGLILERMKRLILEG